MAFWYLPSAREMSPDLNASPPLLFRSVAMLMTSAVDSSSSPFFWSSGKSSYGSPVASGILSAAWSYSSPVSSPQSAIMQSEAGLSLGPV